LDNIKCIFHKCSGRNGLNLFGSGQVPTSDACHEHENESWFS
jgi:hypothetical protein